LGAGVINPAARRWRMIDGLDTVIPWWCLRCQAIVSGPLSRPLLVSFSRSSMIRDAGLRQARRRGVRPARPRPERAITFDPVASQQPRYPTLRNPVVTSHLRLAAALDDDGGDDQTSLRHPPNVAPINLFRCLDTSYSYVLTHHTAPPTAGDAELDSPGSLALPLKAETATTHRVGYRGDRAEGALAAARDSIRSE
jgi:hypothetical protein